MGFDFDDDATTPAHWAVGLLRASLRYGFGRGSVSPAGARSGPPANAGEIDHSNWRALAAGAGAVAQAPPASVGCECSLCAKPSIDAIAMHVEQGYYFEVTAIVAEEQSLSLATRSRNLMGLMRGWLEYSHRKILDDRA